MSDATNPTPDRRYSVDEVGEYIRLATSIEQHGQDGLSYDQLVEVAGEVGVSESALRSAMEQARHEQTQAAESASPLRSIADRCLEILCLKPVTQRGQASRS